MPARNLPRHPLPRSRVLIVVTKTLHILSAMLFLGAGLMTAYYKVRADRSGDIAVVAWYQREIVRADWTFTLPSGFLLPATGFGLVHLYGLPLTTRWVMFGIVGFALSGLLWLPALWLQLRMSQMADAAHRDGVALPGEFHIMNRAWTLLGVPAFLIAILTVLVMVGKSTIA